MWPKAKDNFIILMVAKRRSGKSTLISNLLTKEYQGEFDKIIIIYPHIFSQNKEHNPYLKFQLPYEQTYEAYSNELIENILATCVQKTERGYTDRTLLILDDCISEHGFKNTSRNFEHPLDKIAVVGRRANLSMIVSSQTYNGISTALRTNTDVFCLWRSYGAERTNLIRTFSMTPDFPMIYDTSTREPHSFVVWNEMDCNLYRYDPKTNKYYKIAY